MYSKSDDIEIMISDEENGVIEESFDSQNYGYQNSSQSVKSSELLFIYVQLLYYKCHKTNPNCDRSYIDSPGWIKNKKTTINPINKKK